MSNSVPYLNFCLSVDGGHIDWYQMFTFYIVSCYYIILTWILILLISCEALASNVHVPKTELR